MIQIYFVMEALEGKPLGAYSAFCRKCYGWEEALREKAKFEAKGYEVAIIKDISV